MSAPSFAYLDTNAVNDFSEPRLPVDQAMRKALLVAVDEGRLVVPFSEAVAQEVAARSPRDFKKAVQLGRFYLRIASRDHALEPTGHALRQAIGERLGDPAGNYYKRLNQRERRNIELRLLGKARGHLAALVDDYRRESGDWASSNRGSRDRARELVAADAQARGEGFPKPTNVTNAVEEMWPNIAPDWAWETVESRGLLDRVQQAGLSKDDVLGIPGLRAAVGVAVALATTQVLNNRDPQPADYGDFQHVTLAACAGIPLVTHDERLRKLVAAILGAPLEVISAGELVARVSAPSTSG